MDLITQQREEHLNQLRYQMNNEILETDSYGIAVFVKANHPCGGNGGFLWAASYEQFTALVRHLAYFYVEIQNPALNHQIWDEINPLVDQMVSGELAVEAAWKKINEALSRIDLVIEWWGKAGELMTAVENAFACEIREQFWEETDEEKNQPCRDAIPAEKTAAFLAWVREWV